MKKKQVLPIIAVVVLLSSFLTGTGGSLDSPTAEDQLPVPDRHSDDRGSRSGGRPLIDPAASIPALTTTTASSPTTTSATTSAIPAPPNPRVAAKDTRPSKAAAEKLPVPPTASNQEIVRIALAQVGKRYRSGATGPDAFDCSGLIHYVFNQAGVKVPRLTSDGYFARYPHVTRTDLQPGDVIVYPNHIAIYVGDGLIVSASTPGGGVKHYGMNNPGHIIGFARIS